MSKKNNSSIFYIMSIAYVLFALLLSVHFWSFNESFYKDQHDKLLLYGQHISEYIGFSDDDLAQLTHFTLDYLNDPKASLDKQMNIKGQMREVFTDDEKAHMVDVQRLNLAANYLCIISLIVFVIGIIKTVIRKKDINDFYKAYRNVLKVMLGIIAVLGIWIIIDFDSFWNSFHHVFFPGNDLWILDLRKDILIMIVPPEFFNNLVIRIVITFVLMIVVLYVLLYLIGRKKNDKYRAL